MTSAAQYFGFAPEGRTYVEGADIARVWREDPERLLVYRVADGDTITESAAILIWLTDRHPEAGLAPGPHDPPHHRARATREIYANLRAPVG